MFQLFLFSPGQNATWKRIWMAPFTIHIRLPKKVKNGKTSSMRWLDNVSKLWNHHGERCM